MLPDCIWTLFSVRELGTLIFSSSGTLTRGVLGSAAARIAAVAFLFIIYTHPLLALWTVSTFGIRLLFALFHSFRQLPPTTIDVFRTLRPLRIALGARHLLAAPGPGSADSHFSLSASTYSTVSTWLNDVYRLFSTLKLLEYGPRLDVDTMIAAVVLIQPVVFLWILYRRQAQSDAYLKIVDHRQETICAQNVRLAYLAAAQEDIETQLGQQCLHTQQHAAVEHELQEQVERDARTILRLGRSVARRDERLDKTEDDLDDKTLALEMLKDKHEEHRAEFDHYRLEVETDIQRSRDRSQELESSLANQKQSFDRKIDRLYHSLEARESKQDATADAQRTRIAELESRLADRQSQLHHARSSACSSGQQVLSLENVLRAVTTRHQLHVGQCEEECAARDCQLKDAGEQRDNLAKSLDFATVEHHLHAQCCLRDRVSQEQRHTDHNDSVKFPPAEHYPDPDVCPVDRTDTGTLPEIEDLVSQLSDERRTRKELQQEYDGLSFRLSTVSRALATEESRRKEAERQLDLERRRYRLAADALRTGPNASGSSIHDLVHENVELDHRLSTVSKAYAIEEAQRNKAETALYVERQRHQLAVQSYRTGQAVSDVQIDHLMNESDELRSRLSTVSQAHAAEECQRKQAQQDLRAIQQELDAERRRHRLTRVSYSASQRTSDSVIDHLMGIPKDEESPDCTQDYMDSELLMDIILPEGAVEGSDDVECDSALESAQDQSERGVHILQDLQELQQATRSDVEESYLTSSPSSMGHTTINTPALTHAWRLSRSPSASPALMTPGSVSLPLGLVFRKPEIMLKGGVILDNTPRFGL